MSLFVHNNVALWQQEAVGHALHVLANTYRLICMHRVNNDYGISLVEIMTVITIITVLATIAIPNFMKWMPNMRLKSSARGVYSTLQKAKVEAVKRNACIGVRFSTVTVPATGGGYTLFLDDGSGGGAACNGTQDGTELQISTNMVAVDTSLTKATFPTPAGVSQFCFSPSSVTCGSNYGEVVLVNSNARRYRIDVLPSGGLRMTDGS